MDVAFARGCDKGDADDRRHPAADNQRQPAAMGAVMTDGAGKLDRAGHGRPRAEGDERGAGIGRDRGRDERGDRQRAERGVDPKPTSRRTHPACRDDRGEHVDDGVGRDQSGGPGRNIRARARGVAADDNHERCRPHQGKQRSHERDPRRISKRRHMRHKSVGGQRSRHDKSPFDNRAGGGRYVCDSKRERLLYVEPNHNLPPCQERSLSLAC